MLAALAAAADALLLPRLRQLCEAESALLLDVYHLVPVLQLAEWFNADQLMALCARELCDCVDGAIALSLLQDVPQVSPIRARPALPIRAVASGRGRLLV